MENRGQMKSPRKISDPSTRVLCQSYQQSDLVADQEELGERNDEFDLRNIFVNTSKGFLTCRETLRHEASGFLPLRRRKSCYRFLTPLKIHWLLPGLNPRTLGPMANTLTITPPRTTHNDELHNSTLYQNIQVFRRRGWIAWGMLHA
jgi:hypothetical protein